MRLLKFTKKEEKETPVHNSFLHFYEEYFNGKDDNFSAVTRYINKGYKLTEKDLEYIVYSNIPFLPTTIREKDYFDIYSRLEEKILSIFIKNKKYADVVLELLTTVQKGNFYAETYKTAATIVIEYLLSKRQIIVYEELYKNLLPYCLPDEKYKLAARVSDDCLVLLIKDSPLEALDCLSTLIKIKLSKNALLFLYKEHKDIFDRYCKEGGEIESTIERVFISAKALPDEYYEKNWVSSENLEFLKHIYPIRKIESFFLKRFPDTAGELSLYINFICENGFSEVFWEDMVDKILSYEDSKTIIKKLSQNPRGLRKLIEARCPLEKII